MNIQWYPGHMTKTRRMIAEQIKNVDAVCEILDARIPVSSRNPDVDELTAGKPRMVVLNRVDQADPEGTKRWAEHFRAKGYAVLESDAKSGVGTAKFAGAVRELLADKLRAYAEKGMTGRVVRVMILGIPNVGKSTFINKVAGRKTAKTEDRPGVTRSKQWVPIDRNLELLDTPGILWPKFDDQSVGMNLAYTGAVKDDILDVETLGCHLMAYLGEHYPDALKAAYKLSALPEREAEKNDIAYGYRLLEAAGKKRGFLISGGEVDTERAAKMLVGWIRSAWQRSCWTSSAPPSWDALRWSCLDERRNAGGLPIMWKRNAPRSGGLRSHRRLVFPAAGRDAAVDDHTAWDRGQRRHCAGYVQQSGLAQETGHTPSVYLRKLP